MKMLKSWILRPFRLAVFCGALTGCSPKPAQSDAELPYAPPSPAEVMPPDRSIEKKASWTHDDRQKARARKRRIIYNNDGTDFHTFPQVPITSEEVFLSKRLAVHKDTMVDTIAYCTTAGSLGTFMHRTKIGQMMLSQEGTWRYNALPALLKLGTDPLDAAVRFCRKHDIEVLWSFRMNDTHDYNPKNTEMFFSKFKKENPDVLFGTREAPPRFGRWSGVDYLSPKVRQFARELVDEVLANYDVDGVELDFWRHPVFFKDLARGEEVQPHHLEAMTSLIREIRADLDRAGVERGRYLSLAIRYPDSVPYCRSLGLDLEEWLHEDLVDLLIPGGGYFQLNQWTESVALGKRFGVPVYPSFADIRMREQSDIDERNRSSESIRARAAAAWAAGANGIAMYNYNSPAFPLWKEVGSYELLQQLPKRYFVSPQGEGGRTSMRSRQFQPADQFVRFPTLSPDSPETIAAGASKSYPLWIGDDLTVHPDLSAELILRSIKNPNSIPPLVAWDGRRVELNPFGDSGEEWAAKVPAEAVRPGPHEISVANPDTERAFKILDLKLEIAKKEAGPDQ